MAVSMEDIRRVLDPDEPSYEAAADLGEEAVPHLQALVAGDDPMLAAKATYAASLLAGDTGKTVVQAAAQSPNPTVRVSAAAAARNLPPAAARDVLGGLSEDDDAGIQKVARLSAARLDSSG